MEYINYDSYWKFKTLFTYANMEYTIRSKVILKKKSPDTKFFS